MLLVQGDAAAVSADTLSGDAHFTALLKSHHTDRSSIVLTLGIEPTEVFSKVSAAKPKVL